MRCSGFIRQLFAINSAVHSYLIVAYAEREAVSLDVGFYYMSNAAGRLAGTVLSGYVYQRFGFEACLVVSTVFVAAASIISAALPRASERRTGAARDDAENVTRAS